MKTSSKENSLGGSASQGQGNKDSLTFIVDGEEVVVDANVNTPLRTAAQQALNDSGSAARPLAQWEVKFDNQILDLGRKIIDYNFPDNALIYMNAVDSGGGEE